VIERHGWTLLFNDCLIGQLQRLEAAVQRAREQDPHGFEANANVKLFNALAQVMLETVPSGPEREEFRQGNTMGASFRHWRRAKVGRRFRLFFRFDSRSGVIVFAWVSHPYAVFQKMLERGHPADDWAALRAACAEDWK